MVQSRYSQGTVKATGTESTPLAKKERKMKGISALIVQQMMVHYGIMTIIILRVTLKECSMHHTHNCVRKA